MSTAKLDFGPGFAVTESPADEFNIALDLALKDEGTSLPLQPFLDVKGAYAQAIDDAAATATKIRGSYALFDAIVDSAQHESLDTGTATAGGASTLTDGAKAWAVNNWAGCRVVITGGTGIGQVRVISSNTATVLTVSATWTTNPDGTSTYLIQPSPPVYRRLAEAIAGGHASIMYRQASGEVDFSIASGDAVNYIFGDDVGGADITVAITCNRNGVIFQNLRFTGNKALTLNGTANACVGVQFSTSAYVRLVGTASSLIACFFTGAGGAAQTPVSLEGAGVRVQACSFQVQSSATLIQATAAASNITITGVLNIKSAETGWLIDLNNAANTCSINGCFLNVPTTAAGAIRVQNTCNVSGNYISLSPGTGTYEGVNFLARCVITGNVIQSSAVNAAGRIVNLLHCAAAGASGSIVASNLLYCTSYTGTTGPVLRAFLVNNDASGNVFSGNTIFLAVALSLSPSSMPIGVDPQNAAAASMVVTGNVWIGTTYTPPYPWKVITRITKRTIVDGNDGVKPMLQFTLLEAEDFRAGAIPTGWTAFGAQSPTYPSVQGGVARCSTGTTTTKDSGLKQNLDHVSFDNGNRAFVSGHFNIDVVTNCKVWLGLAPNASWAASMTRPTNGVFLELDTAVTGDTGTANDENGTTSAATATVLTDAAKAWAASQWIGASLRYTSGPALGQSRGITASAATTLTTSAFSPAPTAGGGDTYVIEADTDTLVDSTKAWTVNMWANREVQLTGGTGSGQTRKVVSNTATVLVLSPVWATAPDNTTTYSIPTGFFALVMDGGTVRTMQYLGAAATGVHTFLAQVDASDRLQVWFDGVMVAETAAGYTLPATLLTPGFYAAQSSAAIVMDVSKMVWGCDQL